MIATKVSGAFSSVSIAKNASTVAVIRSAMTMIAGLLPVSLRRRQPAMPTSRKMTRATALPTEAIAERSTRLATIRTAAAVMSSPAWRPRRDLPDDLREEAFVGERPRQVRRRVQRGVGRRRGRVAPRHGRGAVSSQVRGGVAGQVVLAAGD